MVETSERTVADLLPKIKSPDRSGLLPGLYPRLCKSLYEDKYLRRAVRAVDSLDSLYEEPLTSGLKIALILHDVSMQGKTEARLKCCHSFKIDPIRLDDIGLALALQQDELMRQLKHDVSYLMSRPYIESIKDNLTLKRIGGIINSDLSDEEITAKIKADEDAVRLVGEQNIPLEIMRQRLTFEEKALEEEVRL